MGYFNITLQDDNKNIKISKLKLDFNVRKPFFNINISRKQQKLVFYCEIKVKITNLHYFFICKINIELYNIA